MFERSEDFEEGGEQSEVADEDLRHHFHSSDAPPAGHGQVEDFTVSDDSGRLLTLRTEDGTQAQLDKAYEADTKHKTHQVRVRMYNGNREVGSATASIEVEKDFNSETGHYDQVADSRLKITYIETHPDYRRSGIGQHLLERSEEIGRQARVREVYGDLTPEARPFFEKADYQFRPRPGGGTEIYKSCS